MIDTDDKKVLKKMLFKLELQQKEIGIKIINLRNLIYEIESSRTRSRTHIPGGLKNILYEIINQKGPIKVDEIQKILSAMNINLNGNQKQTIRAILYREKQLFGKSELGFWQIIGELKK